jgi:hypothetical protein
MQLYRDGRFRLGGKTRGPVYNLKVTEKGRMVIRK